MILILAAPRRVAGGWARGRGSLGPTLDKERQGWGTPRVLKPARLESGKCGPPAHPASWQGRIESGCDGWDKSPPFDVAHPRRSTSLLDTALMRTAKVFLDLGGGIFMLL